jgi:hypothetical protein
MPLAVIIAGTTAIIPILIAKFRIDFSNETRVLCRVFLLRGRIYLPSAFSSVDADRIY